MNRRIPPAIQFARIGALTLSLGVAAWLILGAQHRAADGGAAKAGAGTAATVPLGPTDPAAPPPPSSPPDDAFLWSSKSGRVQVLDLRGATGSRAFLPSSKFGPVTPPTATKQRQ